MRRCLLLLSGALLVAAAITVNVHAQDTDEDKPIDQQRAELKQEAQTEVQQFKTVRAKSIEQVLQFKIENNDLVLHSSLPATDSNYVHLNVAGLSNFCKVQINAAGTHSFQLIDQQFPPDGIVVLTMVFAIPNHLQISRDEDRGDERSNVQLIQSGQDAANGEDHVKLYINVTRRNGQTIENQKLSAANILELRRKYPLELARYVEPIFRDLHQEAVLGEVDSKLAWQVFAPLYHPDAALEARVGSLVRQLDADDFAGREAASRQLQRLCPPAAVVLMRMDRTGMSDEEQTRIDAVIAPYKPLSDVEATKLCTNKFFLSDCLYCDDIQIRRWALGQLQQTLGHAVAFDVNASHAARVQAVGDLRQSLLGIPGPTRSSASATQASSPSAPASAPTGQ